MGIHFPRTECDSRASGLRSGFSRPGRTEAEFSISGRRLWDAPSLIRVYYKNNNFGPLAVPGPLDYVNCLFISSFPIHYLFITYSISYSITYFILLRFPHYLFILSR